MIRRIYHGSDHIIECPRLGLGKPYNDYGPGFYCTEQLAMAKEWGARHGHDGFANVYDICMDGLSVLDLNGGGRTILHWLAVLLQNRTFDISFGLAREARAYLLSVFAVDYSTCDVMVGYRADDSYFSFAQDFLNGSISLRQLDAAMHLGDLGQQFVLKSERAFQALAFAGYELAQREVYYPRARQRDAAARQRYFSEERMARRPGDVYITQILDEGMGPDDERLQRNLS